MGQNQPTARTQSLNEQLKTSKQITEEERKVFELWTCLVLLEKAREFVKLEQLNPKAVDTHLRMHLLLNLKQYQDALKFALLTLQLAQYAKVCLYIAMIYELSNVPQQDTMEILKLGLKIKPHSKCLNIFLGLYYVKINQIENAINCFKMTQTKKENPHIQFMIGTFYQMMNDHVQAIEYITKAHLQLQKRKFFIAKINSFKAIGDFEKALECCDIAISLKPQKQDMYYVKIDLLEKLGRGGETESIRIEIEKINNDYSLDNFQKKRELENEKTLLVYKQSQIRIKTNQTQSQIQKQKIDQSLQQYSDALFFTFAFYFCVQLGIDQLKAFSSISNVLQKNNAAVNNLFDLLQYTLKTMYPKIQKISEEQEKQIFKDWFEKKIQPKIQSNPIEFLRNLINYTVESNEIQNQVKSRLGETHQQQRDRQSKNSELFLLLSNLAQQAQEDDNQIYSSKAGLLGLEHSLQLLGFVICFPELVNDIEDIDTLVYRLFQQKDIQQFYSSQMKVILDPQQQQQKEQSVQNIQKKSKIVKKTVAFDSEEFIKQYKPQ